MFCIKCGTRLGEEDNFCIKCGYKVQRSEVEETSQISEEERLRIAKEQEERKIQDERLRAEENARIAREQEEKARIAKEKMEEEIRAKKEQAKEAFVNGKNALEAWVEKIKKEVFPKVMQYVKENKKNCQIAAGVVLAIVVALLLFSQRKLNVELNKFVTIEFQGYSDVADVIVSIDEDAFFEEYGERIKEQTGEDATNIAHWCSFFEYELSKGTAVSNGDVITLTWKNDSEKAAKDYKIRLKDKELKVEVSGLEERDVVNVFDYIDVVASGVNGAGTATLSFDENAPEFVEQLFYYMERETGLKNGDEVVVEIDIIPGTGEMIPEGITLAETKHTYVISGLAESVTSIDQISKEAVYVAIDKANEHFTAFAAEGLFGWNDSVAIKSMNCIGHFLSMSASEGGTIANCLGLIFEVDMRLIEEEEMEDFSYYYLVMCENVAVNEEGDIVIDYVDTFDHTFFKGIAGKTFWKFWGFESLEELLEEAYYNPVEYKGSRLEPKGYVEENHSQNHKVALDPKYINSSEKITEASMQAFFAKAEESFINTTKNWKDSAVVKEVEAIGAIFARNDFPKRIQAQNYLGVLLEIKVELTAGGMKEEFTYYDIYLNTDIYEENGKIVAEWSSDQGEGPEFKKMLGDTEIWEAWEVGPSNVWMFSGFQTMEEVQEYANRITNENLLYQSEIILY